MPSDPNCGTKVKPSRKAPIASQERVMTRMDDISFRASNRSIALTCSEATFIVCNAILLRRAMLKKVVKVTIPRPPNWINARITPCPKGVQKVPVSTTTKPVTQEAEVAVNRVVKKSVKVPERLQTGRVSTKAPANINRAKLETMTRAGLFKKFGRFFPKRFK